MKYKYKIIRSPKTTNFNTSDSTISWTSRTFDTWTAEVTQSLELSPRRRSNPTVKTLSRHSDWTGPNWGPHSELQLSDASQPSETRSVSENLTDPAEPPAQHPDTESTNRTTEVWASSTTRSASKHPGDEYLLSGMRRRRLQNTHCNLSGLQSPSS